MRALTLETPAGPLPYSITRRARVTKRLHMELDESGGLVVVAPRHWSTTLVCDTLAQNTSRVERFLARARRRQVAPLQYKHGAVHLYLGERYPLAIHKARPGKNRVAMVDGEIRIDTSIPGAEAIQARLQDWYLREARVVCSDRLQAIARKAPWAAGKSVPLKLRRMKRTWGNCSSKGVIKLNTHLIKAPLPIVDSVIAHELCHLVEMNHSRAFYKLLEELNPAWRQDRMKLRSEGGIYLL